MVHRAVVGCKHHTRNGRQHSTNDEGGRNHHVGLHTHEGRDTRVLRSSAHGTAQFGGVDQPHEHSQRNGSYTQNHDLRRADHSTAQLNRCGRQQSGEWLVVGLPDDHGQGLQQDAHANGGDERRQFGAVAQRTIGNFFNCKIEAGSHHTGNDQRNQEHQPTRQAGHRLLHQGDHRPAGEGRNHEHFAVGKVDQIDNTVHHGVTQSNQGIHAALYQAVDHLLNKNIHTDTPKIWHFACD